jgi:hypothetical protein
MIEFIRGICHTAKDNLDAGLGEHRVEPLRVLAVPAADEVAGFAAGVLQLHGEVAGGLGDPDRTRVGGGAEDPHAPGGVLDDREDVHPRAGRLTASKKSAARIAWACERKNVAQVCDVRSGAGSMPASLRICHTVEAATLTPRTSSSSWMRRYPHELFSRASRRTRMRIDRTVGGRLGRLGREIRA